MPAVAHAMPLIAASASHATGSVSLAPSAAPASVAAPLAPDDEQATHVAINAQNAMEALLGNVTGDMLMRP